MPGNKYRVKWTDEEHDYLEGLISSGTTAARKASHAHMNRKGDEGCDEGYCKDKDSTPRSMEAGGHGENRARYPSASMYRPPPTRSRNTET